MKKLLLSAFVAFAMLASTKTLAQQGFGTNQPDRSAAVDILSSKRGLLIPRLDLSNITVAAPVDAPAHGLLVYNKKTITGTNGVEPGFYYWERNDTTDETAWQGKWVRIVSSNTEKITKVIGGNNVKVVSKADGLTTTHTVSVEGGNEGQVLVTILNPSYDSSDQDSQQYISDWVNPEDFIDNVLEEGNAINITKDSATGKIEVKFDGNLTEDTTIATGGTYDLAITGLEKLTASNYDAGSQNIVVMGPDGILKEVSPSVLISDAIDKGNITAKAIKTDGMITLNGNTTDAADTVLKDVTLGIKDKSITTDKLSSVTPGGTTNAPDGTIATADGNGGVAFESASDAIGKTLSTDGIIGIGATSGTINVSNTIDGAVLTPTYLKIQDNSITALQIGTGAVGANELATGAVTADKLSTKDSENGTAAPANTVPVANSNGTVTYKTVAEVAGEDLTTDGKIVIGATGTSQSLTDAVLVATHLRIAPESITSADILNGTIESTDIKDGTIQVTDIKAPGTTPDSSTGGTANQVMVTNVDGDVTWIDQSALPSNTKLVDGTNTTVTGTGAAAPNEYKVNVATASGTTLGVVKQAATSPEVAIAPDGSLSVNEQNVMVGLASDNTAQGDVSGNLSNLKVTGIQGTAVSPTLPSSTNNMLVYNSTSNLWEPSTVAQAAGKTLTGDGITVTAGTTAGTDVSLAASVLADVTLGIANDAITSEKIKDGEVKTDDLANTSVTAGKLVADLNGSDVNKIPVANANGSVEYKDAATALGKQLTSTSITVSTLANKALLQDLNIDIKPGTAANQILTTVDNAGTLTTGWASPNSLVTVDNGLNKDNTDIELGGALKRATVITTGVNNTNNPPTPAPANTLGIQGLIVPVAEETEVMYAEGTTGILRKAARSISVNVVENQLVSGITGYNDFVQEVNILANIPTGPGSNDVNITLPTASPTNKGQVVNVKVGNTSEPANYVNILVSTGATTTTTLTYGALPYQSWIVKSNGTTWEVVGRN